MTNLTPSAQRWLHLALAQADKIVGHTADNPAVGCVIIDKDGLLAGVGHTSLNGRPHAEINALLMAGDRARGGTVFVTLEPCSHQGQTGPCSEALIRAGVKEVVIAAKDPDPRVDGQGIKSLRDKGIIVTYAPQPRAMIQMAGFLSKVSRNRPYVTVKMATSRNGFIAAKQGAQTWLTGPVSRQYVHDLRSRHQVMLTSFATIKADNPLLNVRKNNYPFPQPALAVIDSHAGLASDMACLTPSRDVILYHRNDVIPQSLPPHVQTVPISYDETGPYGETRLSLPAIMTDLSNRGFGSVMVEAGASLFAGLRSHDLIDRLIWLSAPHELPSGLLAWPGAEGVDFSEPNDYIKADEFFLGQDTARIFYPSSR
ncbi:MAG: bifunctional diaminohydroxyphosphoribosylaminopyrimidine deaminase/5-amino-6-(5-phosphoribosylamino)uracil reductase RibD [Candidatus Puniceispirillaceae bacterium]